MGVQLYPLLAFWEAWNSFTLQVWLNPLFEYRYVYSFWCLASSGGKDFSAVVLDVRGRDRYVLGY